MIRKCGSDRSDQIEKELKLESGPRQFVRKSKSKSASEIAQTEEELKLERVPRQFIIIQNCGRTHCSAGTSKGGCADNVLHFVG